MNPWDIAAGVIIGGLVLDFIRGGFKDAHAAMESYADMSPTPGFILAGVGLGVTAWIIWAKTSIF